MAVDLVHDVNVVDMLAKDVAREVLVRTVGRHDLQRLGLVSVAAGLLQNPRQRDGIDVVVAEEGTAHRVHRAHHGLGDVLALSVLDKVGQRVGDFLAHATAHGDGPVGEEVLVKRRTLFLIVITVVIPVEARAAPVVIPRAVPRRLVLIPHDLGVDIALVGHGRHAAEHVVLHHVVEAHVGRVVGGQGVLGVGVIGKVAAPAVTAHGGERLTVLHLVNLVHEVAERVLLRDVAGLPGVAVDAHLHGVLHGGAARDVLMVEIRHGAHEFGQVVMAGVAAAVLTVEIGEVVGRHEVVHLVGVVSDVLGHALGLGTVLVHIDRGGVIGDVLIARVRNRLRVRTGVCCRLGRFGLVSRVLGARGKRVVVGCRALELVGIGIEQSLYRRAVLTFRCLLGAGVRTFLGLREHRYRDQSQTQTRRAHQCGCNRREPATGNNVSCHESPLPFLPMLQRTGSNLCVEPS